LTAYLEDRPIYVFDEWAADQDPQFKEIFYFELLARLKAAGKTAIVISHDDRYYHVADRVVKLNYGLIEFDNSIALSLDNKVLAYEAGAGINPGA
jgi:putative ATP-binding cassette transporter